MVARSNEICLTRVYDAPVEVVWEAWTDPEQVAQWWGPRGFTLTTHSKDLRPGGTWSYTMHGPDGVDYPNRTLYYEVEQYKKLVYDHGANDEQPALFHVTVLFSEADGKTTMNMTMALKTAEEAEAMKKFIKQAGGNATWDRLAEYLDETGKQQHSFVINRSFPAPVDTVFQMWADPEHLASWLPPAGFTMRMIRAEMKEGKDCFFEMSNGQGMSFYGKFVYQEVCPPDRIVYLQQFCDKDEKLSRHPGLPQFPAQMQTTLLFDSEDDGGTRFTVISQLLPDGSELEIKVFGEERSGMTLGWTGSFDALEQQLEASAERA